MDSNRTAGNEWEPAPVRKSIGTVESPAVPAPAATETPVQTPPPPVAPAPEGVVSQQRMPAGAVLAAPRPSTANALRKRGRKPSRSRTATAPRPATPTTVATAPAAQPARGSVRTTPTPPSTPQPGERYVVRPGDSLWGIAQRVLGADASSAKASAAVDRLWRDNRARIGTGSRDVLPAGITITITIAEEGA